MGVEPVESLVAGAAINRADGQQLTVWLWIVVCCISNAAASRYLWGGGGGNVRLRSSWIGGLCSNAVTRSRQLSCWLVCAMF